MNALRSDTLARLEGAKWQEALPCPPGVPRRGSLEQALPNELALCNSARTGEEATAGMGHELVEHVELRQEEISQYSLRTAA